MSLYAALGVVVVASVTWFFVDRSKRRALADVRILLVAVESQAERLRL